MPNSDVLNADLIAEIKKYRRRIHQDVLDAEMLISVIDRGPGSHEAQMALDKLVEARMWYGKTLEKLGLPMPPEYRDESEQNDYA